MRISVVDKLVILVFFLMFYEFGQGVCICKLELLTFSYFIFKILVLDLL